MNQHIAKSDDTRKFSNVGSRGRVEAMKLIERFADDLQLALDCGAQKVVGLVICKGFLGGKPRHAFSCLLRIPQKFSSVRMH